MATGVRDSINMWLNANFSTTDLLYERLINQKGNLLKSSPSPVEKPEMERKTAWLGLHSVKVRTSGVQAQ